MSTSLSRAGFSLFLLVLLAQAACGGSAAPATTASDEPAAVDTSTDAKAEDAAGDGATSPIAAKAEKFDFDSLQEGEKIAFMKNEVIPKMTAVLQESGDHEFEKVTCKTCHGSRAAKGDFKMPNEELLALDVKDGFADEIKAHPAMVKFMGERVVPEMAKLLGEEPYNPETHQGFGCFHCHVKAP